MSIMPCLQQNMSVLNFTRQLHDNDGDDDDDGALVMIVMMIMMMPVE